jgi:hypothetical protein
LPAGLGPWPRPLPVPAGEAADAGSSSSGLVSGHFGESDLLHQGAEGAAGGSPFAAAAAAAAVADKLLLLRCLLVYHLQASVLYNAEVSLGLAWGLRGRRHAWQALSGAVLGLLAGCQARSNLVKQHMQV